MTLQELFVHLLKISVSASIIVLIVAVLRLVFRRAPRCLICMLWVLAAIRLLVPVFPESRVSVIPQAVSSGNVVTQAIDYTPQETVRIEAEDPAFWEIVERRDAVPRRDGNGKSYLKVSKETRKDPKTLRGKLPVLSWIWVSGVLMMLVYMTWSSFRIWRKSRLSVHREGDLFYCDEPGTPFVFGLFRPRIYIPSDLTEAAEACVLAHERAHIARKDQIWKLIGFVLLSIYWFNPFLWAGYYMLCRDIEMACDERAVRGQDAGFRRTYSMVLLELSAPKHIIGACPVAFGEIGVKERVRAALRYKKPGKLVIICFITVSLIAAGCALTNQPDVTKSEAQTLSEGSIKDKTSRFCVFAREGDAAGNGWIFSFQYEDFKDRKEYDSWTPRYVYTIDNVRYWDDVPVELVSQSPYTYTYGWGPSTCSDAGFSKNAAGLERDLALIEDVLKEGTMPEDLLAMDPETIEFEVLDKEQFFRLMRKALTDEIRVPERQESFDTLYFTNYYREKEYQDGYVFRFACLKGWGFMDEVFIDVAYGSENQFVLLSDLVQKGEATPEQAEAYKLLRKIAENLKGREADYAYGADSYKDIIIGDIDFSRLYEMTTRLTNNIWDEDYQLPLPEKPAESASSAE